MISVSRVPPDVQFQIVGCGPDIYIVINSNQCRAFIEKRSAPSAFDRDPSGTRSNIGPDTQVELIGETEMTRNRNAKGKPAMPTLLRTLRSETIQGQIIAFLMKNTSVEAALNNFFMERHSLMTHLNIVARNTGIGYSVTGDIVTLELPKGVCDPFEFDL